MESSKVISRSAIALILLFFFLPWITVSCSSNQIISLSGYDLAAGKEVVAFGGAERTEADPIIFLIPLSALVVLFFSFASSSRQASKIQVACALVSIGVLGLKLAILQNNQTSIIAVSTQFGLWGTVVGLFLLLVGGWISSGEEDEQTYIRGQPVTQQSSREQYVASYTHTSPQGDEKKCPYCAEMIKKEAIACRFCGRDIAFTTNTSESSNESLSKAIELTEEEARIIELMAQDMHNMDIAKEMNISPMKSIDIIFGLKERFGVSQNLEVVEFAQKHSFQVKPYTPPNLGIKKCPYCAEEIKAEAIVCRYCNRELNDSHIDV